MRWSETDRKNLRLNAFIHIFMGIWLMHCMWHIIAIQIRPFCIHINPFRFIIATFQNARISNTFFEIFHYCFAHWLLEFFISFSRFNGTHTHTLFVHRWNIVRIEEKKIDVNFVYFKTVLIEINILFSRKSEN